VAVSGWGVPWLDEPGRHDGVVRLSRSVGLPAGWPDVLGLAVRFRTDRDHDLLFATTGSAPEARTLMTPQRDPRTSFFGSLLALRDPCGGSPAAVRRVIYSKASSR